VSRNILGGRARISGDKQFTWNVDEAQGRSHECEIEESRDSGIPAERGHMWSFGRDFRPKYERLFEKFPDWLIRHLLGKCFARRWWASTAVKSALSSIETPAHAIQSTAGLSRA